MTQKKYDIRLAYSRDKMIAIKEYVSENLAYFSNKYPVNIPYKTRIRVHGVEDHNDLIGSKTSLVGGSRDHSDAEDYNSSSGWRRVVSSRGRGGAVVPQNGRHRFPSGSASNENDINNISHNHFNSLNSDRNQKQSSWRQRTTSGSEQNSNGRGFFNNARGRANFIPHHDDQTKQKSLAPGRGFGRGRGVFNRGSYVESSNENGYTQANFRHSYHSNKDSTNDDNFWDENDWVDETSDLPVKEKMPPGIRTTDSNYLPEQPIWIYIDPQEKLQGPFTSNAMSQWFELGYLPLTLQIRKTTESNFTTLEQLSEATGEKNPFVRPSQQQTTNKSKKNDVTEPIALISKFSPKEVEMHFIKFVDTHYPHYGDPKEITESLLKYVNMADILKCITDDDFLRSKIEIYRPLKEQCPVLTVEDVERDSTINNESVDAYGDWRKNKSGKAYKKCAMNEGFDGFHFELESPKHVLQNQVTSDAIVFSSLQDVADQDNDTKELSTIPSSKSEESHKISSDSSKINQHKTESKKMKTKKNKDEIPKSSANQENSIDEGWIAASKSLKASPNVSEPTGKKKRRNKKGSEADSKSQAWEMEMEKRKRENKEKRDLEDAEKSAYEQMVREKELEIKQERIIESQAAMAALQRRENHWKNTNLIVSEKSSPSPSAPVMKPNNVPSFAQIQAEQVAEEAAKLDLELKNLFLGQKATNAALTKPTGWASIAATNITSVQPSIKTATSNLLVSNVDKIKANLTQEQPIVNISNLDAAPDKNSNKKKNTKVALNGHLTKKENNELRTWCQTQISNLPPINSAIDLPTVANLICEMENSTQIKEFVENSFGSSKKVKKFVQDFIQRKAKLSTAY